MPSWGSYSYAFTPLVAGAALLVLVLLLRWTFSRGGSLVARVPREGHEGEYGLLVAIAAPATYVEGELQRRALADAGLRVTLTTTSDGPRVMVFAQDEAAARRVLAGL